ncbi:MAG: bifunctional adenosylcobinamide kinase/adenosylcobinamide-phosphate guanylyltransferase [Alphaproteobacteria bacterium]|nr:bifunctional adenosylcobinamide kinase/adenosylcobinamide-phosphate guanylyltransferase [Alphaproteobacteria bacterium]
MTAPAPSAVASLPQFKRALILGGARSGKSARAEALTLSAAGGGGAIYLATSEAGDSEMTARIDEHRARRGPRWMTREAPIDLPEAFASETRPVLVDCLTLWLSNLMAAGHDVERESERLAAAIEAHATPIVLVSNEVGMGIVPDNALAREFRDHAGRLHQRIAQVADHVELVVAGLPLVLKPQGNS